MSSVALVCSGRPNTGNPFDHCIIVVIVTHDHKLGGLNQHMLILLHFWNQKSEISFTGPDRGVDRTVLPPEAHVLPLEAHEICLPGFFFFFLAPRVAVFAFLGLWSFPLSAKPQGDIFKSSLC